MRIDQRLVSVNNLSIFNLKKSKFYDLILIFMQACGFDVKDSIRRDSQSTVAANREGVYLPCSRAGHTHMRNICFGTKGSGGARCFGCGCRCGSRFRNPTHGRGPKNEDKAQNRRKTDEYANSRSTGNTDKKSKYDMEYPKGNCGFSKNTKKFRHRGIPPRCPILALLFP